MVGIPKLERYTAAHIAALGIFATWAFGGGANWAALIMGVVGSIAPIITVAALRERRAAGKSSWVQLLALWPLLGFNFLVLLGTLQPSLRIAFIEGAHVYVPRSDLSFWPSSARPDLALKQLWLIDATALTCFNVLLAIKHKRILRNLLLILAVNALLLAVFGSIQKFSGTTGLFFGRVPSPNTSFFASFIYHNHWGAYMVLMLAICLGLLFGLQPWSHHRDFWHSPALAAITAIFFLALTIPLSASRSCSLLAVLLLSAALIQGLRRVIKYHRAEGTSTKGATAAIVLALVLATAATIELSRTTIESRITDTRMQVAHMQQIGGFGSRAQLYSDTWHMAGDRPWFGWGLGSYGTVFSFYNTQTSPIDKLPVYYEDAHSDWLQLFAETGAIGTILCLLFLLTPLLLLRRAGEIPSLPRYLFAGSGLILLYASIEFPFGNPAVTLLFWTCYFCGIRWVQLEQRAPVR